MMANACTSTRPLLVGGGVFQAGKTQYNFEPVRAVQHVAISSSLSIVMLFALRSTKPLPRKKLEVTASHAVVSWLRSRGCTRPADESQLSAVVMRELRECFDTLDTHGNGELTLSQLQAALQSSSLFSDPRTVRSLCARMGSPHMRASHLPYVHVSHQVRSLFARMDTDHSGTIGWHEFLAALQSLTTSAGGEAGSMGSDEFGGGTTAENMRLVLFAYAHRQHMQRELGDDFSAKYEPDEQAAAEGAPMSLSSTGCISASRGARSTAGAGGRRRGGEGSGSV